MAKDKLIKVEKSYSFCKSTVYAIQQLTGEQTHDILATLVSKGDELFEMHEIDITKPLNRDGWSGQQNKRNYIYYPGTKLYLGVYVGIRTERPGWRDKTTHNTVTYSFKLPQTYVKMNAQEFDDIAVDGMLTDSSFNFDEPNLKRPNTPAEKQRKYEERQAIIKAKREAKKASKIP